MDVHTVARYRFAHSRADLALEPGERLLGGGTWLFSEPQLDVTGLVDLSTMDWPAYEYLDDGGLHIGATCTIAELTRLPPHPSWRAAPLLRQCPGALLASFKIWNMATVGGNICRAFAAAAMVTLCAALDARALIWTPDGREYRTPVVELVTGNGRTALAGGEVLRAVEVPAHALRARTGFRKIALAARGRSGAVLTGRVDPDGAAVFTITAATLRPVVLRYPAPPDPATLRADALAAPGYYSDPLGAADWRRAVSAVMLEEIRRDLDG